MPSESNTPELENTSRPVKPAVPDSNTARLDASVPIAEGGLADGSSVADPADEIPVPVAMSPAEIDERAQAVEAVRGIRDPEELEP
jgi:hypothetical protein